MVKDIIPMEDIRGACEGKLSVKVVSHTKHAGKRTARYTALIGGVAYTMEELAYSIGYGKQDISSGLSRRNKEDHPKYILDLLHKCMWGVKWNTQVVTRSDGAKTCGAYLLKQVPGINLSTAYRRVREWKVDLAKGDDYLYAAVRHRTQTPVDEDEVNHEITYSKHFNDSLLEGMQPRKRVRDIPSPTALEKKMCKKHYKPDYKTDFNTIVDSVI